MDACDHSHHGCMRSFTSWMRAIIHIMDACDHSHHGCMRSFTSWMRAIIHIMDACDHSHHGFDSIPRTHLWYRLLQDGMHTDGSYPLIVLTCMSLVMCQGA